MYAVLNGVRTFYSVEGTGTPLVCVHGGPGMSDHRGYGRWLAPLAADHQFVLYDLRGCGQSGDAPNGSYSHADFVADLDALREHLGLEHLVLLGTSYGGFIALEYALRHMDRLGKLILVDTAPSNDHHDKATQNALGSGRPGIDRAMLDDLFSGRIRDNAHFRAAFASIQPLYRVNAHAVADAAQLDAIQFRYQTHNFAFSRNLPSYDRRSRLGDISVPTLVMCGRHDWITPRDQSEYMARHIPGARLVIFDRSGHGPMAEENERYLAEVRGFIA
ncbi:MAG: alpha/beta fold hydrolase, partial [Chloroflexota bacterium]